MIDLGGTRVDSEPISLSALEFDVLWEHLKLGQMPLPVKVPSPGKTYEERAGLEERAWTELARRGLGRSVDLDPRLHHWLGLLAQPEREVDGRTWVGRGVRFLAVSVGDEAVLAVLADGWLTVGPTSATGLASAAVGVLPVMAAGPGQSVTLRTSDFEAAAQSGGRTPAAFENGLRSRGVRADDVEAIKVMIKDVIGTGNFGAAVRDKLNRRHRAQRVVSFFDTEEGRYVQIRRASQDGSMWTTISPADPRKLTHHIDEMLGEVVRVAEG